jgi:hypothetical protein
MTTIWKMRTWPRPVMSKVFLLGSHVALSYDSAFAGFFAQHHCGVSFSRFRHLAYDGVLYIS